MWESQEQNPHQPGWCLNPRLSASRNCENGIIKPSLWDSQSSSDRTGHKLIEINKTEVTFYTTHAPRLGHRQSDKGSATEMSPRLATAAFQSLLLLAAMPTQLQIRFFPLQTCDLKVRLAAGGGKEGVELGHGSPRRLCASPQEHRARHRNQARGTAVKTHWGARSQGRMVQAEGGLRLMNWTKGDKGFSRREDITMPVTPTWDACCFQQPETINTLCLLPT